MITIDTHSYFFNKNKKPQTNSSSGGGVSVTTVEHGTSNTDTTISPNTLHKWDEVAELTLALGVETPGIVNEYLIQFTSGATPTVLTLPEDVKWASKLEIKANKIYQISIVNNLAAWVEFSNTNLPSISVNLEELQNDNGTYVITDSETLEKLSVLCTYMYDSLEYYDDGGSYKEAVDEVLSVLGGGMEEISQMQGFGIPKGVFTIIIEGIEVNIRLFVTQEVYAMFMGWDESFTVLVGIECDPSLDLYGVIMLG